MRIHAGSVVLLLLITSASPAAAEVIFLKSGKHVEGKIIKETNEAVIIDAGVDMPITYFRDQIREIVKDLPVDPLAAAQADILEVKAVELIDAERMNEGLDLMRQALVLSPSAQRHMNYGSILFGNGVKLFKEEKKEQGRIVLKDAEYELNKAAVLFDKQKDAFFISQCFFLLGEMYAHAFDDTQKARDYYQEAVDLAGHPGAKKVLERGDKDDKEQ